MRNSRSTAGLHGSVCQRGHNQLPHSQSCYESKPNSASLNVWGEPSSGSHCLWHNTSLSNCRISESDVWAPELGPGTRTENREEVATFWDLQVKGGNLLGGITSLFAVSWRALWTECLAAGQKVSGHQSAAWSASETYRHLRSRHTPTTLCKDFNWGRRCPTTCQTWVYTGTEQSTSGILLLQCKPVLRSERDKTPRKPRAHQCAPAQRKNLPSSPPSLHMEMMAAGAPKGGLPVEARPGLVSSMLTGITLGALLLKDQRHPGWALNCLKHLQNLYLQGFLKQKSWPVEIHLENILLDEDSPAKWAPTGCGTVARRWVPHYRVLSFVRGCHGGSDLTTRGPLPLIDSWHPCTQPSGSWPLIPHPRSPGPHTVAPHSPPHSSQAGCFCSSDLTDLGPDSPPVSLLFYVLDESMSLKACLCPTCTPGWYLHGLLGMSSAISGARPGTYGSHVSVNQCLQPLYIFLLPSSYLSLLWSQPTVLIVSVSVHGWVYPSAHSGRTEENCPCQEE